MTCTPATGWCSTRSISTASAGGQLEQPSDVNNSTTTGTGSAGGPAETRAAVATATPTATASDPLTTSDFIIPPALAPIVVQS